MKIPLLIFFILISSVNCCLVVVDSKYQTTPTPPVTHRLPACLCPPLNLLDQNGVRANVGGHYLGNRQTWRPIINFDNPDSNPCNFNVYCPPQTGISSFFTILLRGNGSPIYINRIIENQSTWRDQPRYIGNFHCGLDTTDLSFQWFFHNSPIYNVSFTCQADVDSCKCPEINIDTNSGAVTEVRYPGAPDQCSLYEAWCVEGFGTRIDAPPLLYSNEFPINAGAVENAFYEDLICIKEYDNSYNWYYFNKKIVNVSISCNLIQNVYGMDFPDVCYCGVFPIINSLEMLTYYDNNNDFDGAIVGVNSWEPSCEFHISCEEGYIGVVFSDNNVPIVLKQTYITCTYNPLSNDLRMWVVNTVRVINPAATCLKKGPSTPPVTHHLPADCLCPPINLLDQDGVRHNAGGRYLGNRQTWLPIINYNNPKPDQCHFDVYCPTQPGISSFHTFLLRSNGSPIYINRVVANQSTFVDQPRSIGNFECAQDTDGTYQWFFHNSPMYDVSFTCQADVDSCKCPEIPVDTDMGTVTEVRYPGAPDQCSLYEAWCVEGFGTRIDAPPLLYSNEFPINAGAVENAFYEDLICIKEYDNSYNWYYFNKKIVNVTISCNSIWNVYGIDLPNVCDCGVFPIINSTEMLENYDKNHDFDGAIVGVNSWEPSCEFNINCEEGYIGVVFSDNNVPIVLKDPYITCTYNPLSNDLRMWVVNSIRVINPAATCLKRKT